jgi:hypothetical protein
MRPIREISIGSYLDTPPDLHRSCRRTSRRRSLRGCMGGDTSTGRCCCDTIVYILEEGATSASAYQVSRMLAASVPINLMLLPLWQSVEGCDSSICMSHRSDSECACNVPKEGVVSFPVLVERAAVFADPPPRVTALGHPKGDRGLR